METASSTNDLADVLCVQEVAAWLGVDRKTIYAAAATGAIPHHRLGKRLLFSRDAVLSTIGAASPRHERTTTQNDVPTVCEFSKVFIETSRLRNKPSTIDAKNAVLNCHILPLIGRMRIDAITYTIVEDLKLALARKKITRVAKNKVAEARTLSPKTINNALMCLHRMLVVARKRGLIERVPDFEWLRAPLPEFDFLDFDEAKRMVSATNDQLRTMVLTALRTGLRHGELLALRWQDVDLVAGRITVRQNVVRGMIGTPKSGKPREIPLGEDVLAALKAHRHLRGPLVFCNSGGDMLTDSEQKNPLTHACRRAGLRPIGWHVLRHSFASQLAMRGATLKVIQELLGHSTITMTMRYAHLAPRVSREAVRMLDDPTPDSEAREELRR
jgi:excisionase family DNA binding protein